MIQVDGGEAVAFLPLGLRLSGYVGAPVPSASSCAAGSRAGTRPAATWPTAGAPPGRWWSRAPPARGLDVGASYARVDDFGDVAREEVAGDFRLQPFRCCSDSIVFPY
ncbi:MAG: hypothetical protein QM767_03815 [Anaeromyxobacter sp.]